jgi:hypothetical protein
MLSTLVYSKQVVEFLDGRVDSLKYAIIELLSIIAFIPTPELKTTVVEAIEVIVGRSDTKDSLKEILSETRHALINQEDK